MASPTTASLTKNAQLYCKFKNDDGDQCHQLGGSFTTDWCTGRAHGELYTDNGCKTRGCPSGFILSKDGKTCQHLKVEQACYLGTQGPAHMKACYGAGGQPIKVVVPSGSGTGTGTGSSTGAGSGTGVPGTTGDQSRQELMELQHTNIMANIKALQNYEKSLFTSLQQQTDDSQRTKITGKINELSQMRTRLFNELRNAYGISSDILSRDRQDLASQLAMIEIVENQLQDVKAEINSLTAKHDDKLRMVEVTNYEYDRYYAHKTIFKTAAYCALAVLISVWIINAGFPTIGKIGIVLSIAYFVYQTGYAIYDLSWRNNMNYKRYDFSFDPQQYQKGYQTVYEVDKHALEKAWKQTKYESKHLYHEGKQYAGQVAGDISTGISAAGAAVKGATSDISGHKKKHHHKKHHDNRGGRNIASGKNPPKGKESFMSPASY